MPLNRAEILTAFESCNRRGYWTRSWVRHRLTASEMFHAAVRTALIEDAAPDPGDNASEWMMTLASERGLDLPSSINLYRCARNHAAIADIVVTAIRQNNERWVAAPDLADWTSSAMMDTQGSKLRRFLGVSHWSDERDFYERRSWYALGEIAHYRLPMQLVVAVLGPMTGGRRHHYWSKALLHPQGSELRFKRSRRSTVEGFKDTWSPIYREEHDEIDRHKWLQAMYNDNVLQEALFVVNIPVPEESQLQTIRDLANRQLERMHAIQVLPEKQLTTCFNPLHPCPFRACCWSDPEAGPEAGGYDAV